MDMNVIVFPGILAATVRPILMIVYRILVKTMALATYVHVLV